MKTFAKTLAVASFVVAAPLASFAEEAADPFVSTQGEEGLGLTGLEAAGLAVGALALGFAIFDNGSSSASSSSSSAPAGGGS